MVYKNGDLLHLGMEQQIAIQKIEGEGKKVDKFHVYMDMNSAVQKLQSNALIQAISLPTWTFK